MAFFRNCEKRALYFGTRGIPCLEERALFYTSEQRGITLRISSPNRDSFLDILRLQKPESVYSDRDDPDQAA